MNDRDRLWQEKWSRSSFASPVSDFSAVVSRYSKLRKFSLFGSDEEPLSSIWMASLSEAVGEHFREGFRVLDYGCGAGRYCNFLAQRLNKFEYYGVEKRGSAFRHGEKSIRVANRMFRHDRRAQFGFIDSAVEAAAIDKVGVVVLGSVFTHVDINEVDRILAKLTPVVDRGGKVVFSVFIANEYRLEGPEAYGFNDCYDRVWFESKQLMELADRNNWQLTECESFLAQGINLHRIFALDNSKS